MATGGLPPISVEFIANATEFLKTITKITSSLEKLGASARAAAEATDAALASMTASSESLTAVAEASTAAKTGMQGFARAARSVGKAMEGTAVTVEEGMAAVGEAADKMAVQVTESADAAALAITSLDEKSAAMGSAFVAGSDEATAALARLTEAAQAAAASMDKVATTSKVSAEESAASAGVLESKWLGLGPVFDKVAKYGSIGIAGIGIESVRMASKFQTSTTQLLTSAGELNKNLSMVRQGLLNMAGQVGVSATDLSKALYYVDAAGYRAGDGLTVLKAAAQGAAAEGADTTTVARALTDVLVDYHLKASDAADVTSKMITAVANGKTNLQEFSGAFASIVPAASAAGISFQDVLSALAQMTNHGFTAARASQNLAQALRSLLNPTTPMKKAFDQFGVSADVLKEKLHGPNGLTDAMEYLSQAATKAGKEGTPEFAAALKQLMGTAPGANAALSTVGANYKATADTIAAVGKTTADASGKVQGFAEVQKTLGQQLKQLRYGFDALMIRLGTALIPQVSKFITLLESRGKPVVEGFSKALSGIASGFTGKATKPAGGHAPNLHNAYENSEVAEAAPLPLTGWQKVGQVLKQVADDLKRFGGEAAKAFGNLTQAAGPTLALLGGALLGVLRAVASILANVVGPALVKVTQFMNQHKGAVRDLVTVALIPLAIRLAALSVLKPIGAIAKLAADVAKFPFSQAKALFEGIKSGISAVTSAATRVREVWGGVRFAAVTVGQSIKDAIGKIPWSSVSSGAAAVGGKLKNTGRAALDLASSVGKAAASGAQAAWSGLTSGLSAVGGALKTAGAAALEFSRNMITSAVSGLRAAAAWTVEKVALVASAIAEKAAAAAQWLLNAAMDANPIGLIIIAIAALVAGLVYAYTHFKVFRDIVNGALRAVGQIAMWLWHNAFEPAFKGIAAVVGWVVGFVKGHWPLLLAILTGPIGIAVLLVIKYWKQISSAFADAYHAVVDVAKSLVHWIAALPGKILSALAAFGSMLWNWATSAWNRAKNAVVSVGSSLLSFVSGIPGRILSALGDTGALLWNAGVSIVQGLISGIQSMISAAGNAISNVVSTIRSFLPFSPAKRGPLSGRGSPDLAGAKIGEMLADGMTGSTTRVGQASHRLASAAALAINSNSVYGTGSLAALAVAASAAGGSAGAPQMAQVQVTVQLNRKVLYEEMQVEALRYGRRNPTTGLVYKAG